MLTAPPHIVDLNLAAKKPKYKDLAFRRRPLYMPFRELLFAMSPRGTLAMSAAMAEWALWRVHGHHESSTESLIEAMWVVAVHPSYMKVYEPPWSETPTVADKADPGWKNSAQSTFWNMEGLHRKIMEGLIGYNDIQDLRHWCLHALPRPVRPTFEEWLLETASTIAQLSPGDPDTFTCCTTKRPDESLQKQFKWGSVVFRDQLDGAAKSEVASSWLANARDNPYLVDADSVPANRPWRGWRNAVPGFTGTPYVL